MIKKRSGTGFIRTNVSFISSFLKNPKEIGAIVPSSPLLGKAMASFIPDKKSVFVVELGPGTGPITKAMLKGPLSEENLFCLEQCAEMVSHLRNRFPAVNVVEGDACEMSELLGDKSGKVDCVVSSLPLKSIPDEIVDQIIEQISLCLSPQGVVVQFTYDLRPWRSPLLKRFDRVKSKMVLGNIPPARVDMFTHRK